MTTEIPQIKRIEQLSVLYESYQEALRIMGPSSSDHAVENVISAEEVSGLAKLVSNRVPYLAVAEKLCALRANLIDYDKNMDKTIEYVINHVRGQFNGKSEAEIKSISYLLGIIPIAINVGESTGTVNGDIDLKVYDTAKLMNVVPSRHQWLKDFLAQYVAEIDGAVESVGEGHINSRFKVEIDRMNNAIRDCYEEKDAIRTKFAVQNLLGGNKNVRHMLFPQWKTAPGDDLRLGTQLINSFGQLVEFANGKQKVSFYNEYNLKICNFSDLTPRPATGIFAFFEKLLS